MALRLVATRSKCHLIFPAKNFRTCIDLQKLNASTMSNDFLKNLSALMMNKKPVKGFEKFYKDKNKIPTQSSDTSKEKPKEESSKSEPPPSKSAKSPDDAFKEFKKEFQFKIQMPSSGGGKGSSSGKFINCHSFLIHHF